MASLASLSDKLDALSAKVDALSVPAATPVDLAPVLAAVADVKAEVDAKAAEIIG